MKKQPATQLTSKHLNDLLQNAIKDVDQKRKTDPQAVLHFFEQLLQGPQRKGVKALRFVDGVLHVAVANSPLLSVLELYQKKTLLQQMQNKFPQSGIRNIAFRLG